MALPNIIELCAGYGGIGLGLTLALGETHPLCYVEREISVARKLVARFQDGTLAAADIWSDVKTFDGRPYRGKTDILCAGYPCQPFSCAGKQLAEKDPRHLWPHVARIIREVRPDQVFLENVDAHLRLGFLEVARELQGMGYRIAAGLFSAEEVGAPHRRLRLFALAERTGGRRGKLRQSSRSQGFTNWRGKELADTGGAGRRPEMLTRSLLTTRYEGPHPEYPCGSGELEDPTRLPEHGCIGQDGGRRRGICQASDGVANAPRKGSPSEPQGRIPGRLPNGSRQPSTGLADSGNRLVSVTGRRSQGRTGVGSAGADVADAGLARRGRTKEPQEVDRPGPSNHDCGTGRTVADAERAERRAHFEHLELPEERDETAGATGSGGSHRLNAYRDGSVADAARERHPLPSHRQDQEAELAASVRSGIPIFPPGPADLEAWAGLLVQRPDVEPAVCRVAYERADRVDGRRQSSRVSRLRALGNGVFPLVAGLAYATLRAALREN